MAVFRSVGGDLESYFLHITKRESRV
jgi:hypothetical protein